MADDIAFAHFESVPVRSADGAYLAAVSERGLLSDDKIEDELRIYRISALKEDLRAARPRSSASSVVSAHLLESSNGRIVRDLRWTSDSKDLAFLARCPTGETALFLMNVSSGLVTKLSVASQDVLSFDIKDRSHFAYVVRQGSTLPKSDDGKSQSISTVGTGRSLESLLFPGEEFVNIVGDRGVLWAAAGTKPTAVVDPGTRKPIVLYRQGQFLMSLSPGGNQIVTATPLEEVPREWPSLYLPPFEEAALRSGSQDINAPLELNYVSQFVLIDIGTGTVRPLTQAPTGESAEWWAAARSAWSDNGDTVLLPGSYLKADNPNSRGPCVVFLNIERGHPHCVMPLAGNSNDEAHNDRFVGKVSFVGRGDAVRIEFVDPNSGDTRGDLQFQRQEGRRWVQSRQRNHAYPIGNAIDFRIEQGLNDPPQLKAVDARMHRSMTIWNPNEQMGNFAWGEAKIYEWPVSDAHKSTGVLYMPAPGTGEEPYPLVIQTHGASLRQFLPSGLFTTGFAARELASLGIAVLQVDDTCLEVEVTTKEAQCASQLYETAVKSLSERGVIDPGRVGIIGFSRTCFYVMHALTSDGLSVRAALISDGVMGGYMTYLNTLDAVDGNPAAEEFNAMIGGRPFGSGLPKWIERAPLFRLDRVNAPLMVVALGRSSLLETMWEPYAGLRYLNKPVDLILLRSDEHELTNPRVRKASQEGSVDWFRFWLQGAEDQSGDKVDQYVRWRKLRKLASGEL